ncbi:MAG: hypothetical protein QXQ39_03715 [Conexivisphaerales archaeon]
MVIAMQVLTGLDSCQGAMQLRVAAPDASMVLICAQEPLNGISSCAGFTCSSKGKSDGILACENAIVSSLAAVYASRISLMGCKTARSRKLLERGRVVKNPSKSTSFCIKHWFNVNKSASLPFAIGIEQDKSRGISVARNEDTTIFAMSDAVDLVRKVLGKRRRFSDGMVWKMNGGLCRLEKRRIWVPLAKLRFSLRSIKNVIRLDRAEDR